MQKFYKIFLAILVVLTGFSFYAIDWDLGFLAEENTTFILSIAAGLLGILLVIVLHTWSKLKVSKN